MNNRREFLTTAAAMGATAILPGAALIAQNARARGGRIDVHHHMIPRFQPGNNLRDWNPQMSLESCDGERRCVARS